MTSEIYDTLYIMRHPEPIKISNPQFEKQVCPKTTVIGEEGYRQIIEFCWAITQRARERGIIDIETLRTFDHVYSTPSVRGVMAVLGFPENIKIKHRHTLPLDYEARVAQKHAYYNSLGWTAGDMLYLNEIVDAEMAWELKTRVKGIQILDELSETLEVGPGMTGAPMKVFAVEMNLQTFSQFKITNLHKAFEIILDRSPEERMSGLPRKIFCVMHGSSTYGIREAGKEVIGSKGPSQTLLNRTYWELKHLNHPNMLIPHGCGLEIQLDREKNIISMEAIDITEAMKERLTEEKTRMFLE